MSNINANVVVDPITLTVTDAPTTLTSTVDAINLGIYTSQAPESQPGGNIGQLQYNLNDILFAGVANSNIDANGNLVFTNLSNLKILGGSANYQLTTDGTGNLTWTDSITNANFANYAGNVTVSSQPNITSVGNLTSLTVNGNASISGAVDVGSLVVNGTSNLGSESNLTITGGTNGYVLQTDGAGNLTWSAQGGAGNGNPGGSNTQVQFNDNGLFGGSTQFTFDKNTGVTNSNVNLTYGFDNVLLSADTSNAQSLEFINGSVLYQTANANANVTLDFSGNATITLDTLLPNSKSLTGVFVMKNGANAYQIANITIDSVSQNVSWVNGILPTTSSNSQIAYTFTIIKTSTTPTYDVLGSATRFG